MCELKPNDALAKIEWYILRIAIILLLLIGIMKVLKAELSSLW